MDRVIFLVDMNSFFISCEMTRHPELSGKSAAVAGNPKTRTGIILTSNYQARRFGVKTTMLVHEALKLCPELMLIPPDHRFYSEISQQVMNILSCFSPVIEQNSIDEAWLDMTGCQNLFGEPSDSSKLIMNRLKNELDLPCSIGISENKFLSKMASDMKKPMGITELWKSDIEQKLWPLPVQAMYGIGRQTAQKLKSMGIETIGDLACARIDILYKKLGKYGKELHFLARGIDMSPLVPRSNEDIKSIGRSTTLAKDITDLNLAKIVLLKLAEEVASAARKNGKKGRTVQINIKYSNFKSISRQTTVPATNNTKKIFSKGFEMLSKNWKNNLPVRLLGISITGFEADSVSKQLSMFDLPEIEIKAEADEKSEKLDKAVDSIREKYGSSAISRASLIKNKDK